MRSVVVPAIAAWVLAGAALADPPAAKPPPPQPPPRIFLSPSGEPFRTGPAIPDPLRAWFDQVDTKHQGYIDKAEFRADAVRFFKLLDENGDGVIDGFEAADYEHKVVPELAAAAEGRFPGDPTTPVGRNGAAGGDGPRPDHPSHPGDHTPAPKGKNRPPPRRAIGQLLDEPEPVTGADFSFDGHITLAEWMSATDQRFDLLDTDKTGRLTYEALKTKLDGPVKRR